MLGGSGGDEKPKPRPHITCLKGELSLPRWPKTDQPCPPGACCPWARVSGRWSLLRQLPWECVTLTGSTSSLFSASDKQVWTSRAGAVTFQQRQTPFLSAVSLQASFLRTCKAGPSSNKTKASPTLGLLFSEGRGNKRIPITNKRIPEETMSSQSDIRDETEGARGDVRQ